MFKPFWESLGAFASFLKYELQNAAFFTLMTRFISRKFLYVFPVIVHATVASWNLGIRDLKKMLTKKTI